jgi:ankyrin repeat protein
MKSEEDLPAKKPPTSTPKKPRPKSLVLRIKKPENQLFTVTSRGGANNSIKGVEKNQFFQFIQQGDFEKVKEFVDKQIEIVNFQDGYDGRRPLHCAAANGHEGIVRYLIKVGVDVNGLDRKGFLLLHYLMCVGYCIVLMELFRNGAKWDYRDGLIII